MMDLGTRRKQFSSRKDCWRSIAACPPDWCTLRQQQPSPSCSSRSFAVCITSRKRARTSTSTRFCRLPQRGLVRLSLSASQLTCWLCLVAARVTGTLMRTPFDVVRQRMQVSGRSRAASLSGVLLILYVCWPLPASLSSRTRPAGAICRAACIGTQATPSCGCCEPRDSAHSGQVVATAQLQRSHLTF